MSPLEEGPRRLKDLAGKNSTPQKTGAVVARGRDSWFPLVIEDSLIFNDTIEGPRAPAATHQEGWGPGSVERIAH